MAAYTIIEETSETLKDVLTNGLVPELISDKNSIGLCGTDQYGDYTVGINLCEIKESDFLRISGMQDMGDTELMGPPMVVSLLYMIMIHSASEPAYKASNEQKIMGKILQILSERGTWQAPDMGKYQDPDIRLELVNLTADEKSKFWNNEKKAMPTLLFYRAEPIMIESRVRRKIARVRVAAFNVTEKD